MFKGSQADELYPDKSQKITCQSTLVERIFDNPAPFLEAREKCIKEKAGWGHGQIMTFSVKDSEVSTRGIERKVKGPEMDFWPIDVYNMLHPAVSFRGCKGFFVGSRHRDLSELSTG